MSRPIPTHDYVAHFDPELPHHRAWLQAALERLVNHEPEALLEGGPLWRLWSTVPAEAAGAKAEAPTGASDQLYPNPLVGVPFFQQRDSAQLSQRDRTCFSSSCAMLLEAVKPGSLPGANGDDAYLAVVQRYGDTTDVHAQLQALAHFGVTARLVQTADFELIEEQIARGIPVPCGTIHRGPVDGAAGPRLGALADRRGPYPHPSGGERPVGGAGPAQQQAFQARHIQLRQKQAKGGIRR
jgi:hypothetical protein